jgi:hypothetical protein
MAIRTAILFAPLLALPLFVATARGDDAAAKVSTPRNKLVRVVTVSQEGLRDKPGKAMLNATMTRLDRAASFRPDIVCLPEAFTRDEPEMVPGPTTDQLAKCSCQFCEWPKRPIVLLILT